MYISIYIYISYISYIFYILHIFYIYIGIGNMYKYKFIFKNLSFYLILFYFLFKQDFKKIFFYDTYMIIDIFVYHFVYQFLFILISRIDFSKISRIY